MVRGILAICVVTLFWAGSFYVDAHGGLHPAFAFFNGVLSTAIAMLILMWERV